MNVRTEALRQSLLSLPARTVRATMRNPRAQVDRTFAGPALVDYAVAAGVLTAGVARTAPASGYFVITAEDGARVAVSLAEAAPGPGDKGAILATEQDGEPLGVGVRLVVPEYPGLGGRSLMGVVCIAFHDARSDAPGAAVTASPVVSLLGLLDNPGDLDTRGFLPSETTAVETLPGRGHRDEERGARRYSGVLLYRLLEAAGIRLDPEVHEDFLRKVVVATGADGYPAVFAGGEIEPRFMAGAVLVATRRDGAALGAEGPARLVLPGDRGPGRWVRSLVSLTLREG